MTDKKIAKSSLITIRPGEFSDVPFIFSTWLKGLRYGSAWHKDIEQEAYFEGQHKVIEKILQDPDTEVNIACLKDTPEVIVGYSISTDATTLHYVHVKVDWRGIGLAKDLTPPTVTQVSHVTKAGLAICKKKSLNFNPFSLSK